MDIQNSGEITSNSEDHSETQHVQTYISNQGLHATNDQLKSVADNLGQTTESINSLNSSIDEKRQRLMRQEAEIAQKKKIILTRNRMLNISEANNRL